MTIKFENIYECEKISSNLLFQNIYEYEKISSNLLFENIIKFVIWKYLKNIIKIGIPMAHLLGVRHKYIDSNGAPSPGAPLVTFFGFLVAFICKLVTHLWIWKNIIKFEKIFMNSKSAHEI